MQLNLPPGVRRYAGYYRTSRARLALGVALGLVRALVVVPIPLLVGLAIDQAIPNGDRTALIGYGVAILGLTLIGAAISMATRYVTVTAIRRAIRLLREDAINKLFTVSRRFYTTTEPSVLHDQIIQESGRVNAGTSAVLTDYIPGIVVVLALGGVLIAMNPTLALVTLGFAPLIVITGRMVGKALRVRIRLQHEAFEAFSRGVLRLLRAMDLVRTHGAEQSEFDDLIEKAEELERVGISRTVWNNFYSVVQSTLIATAGTAVLILGGVFVIAGDMTLGDLIAFYAAFALIRGPLGSIALRAPAVIEGLQSLSHLEELLDEPDVRPYLGTSSNTVIGPVVVSNVTFAYDEKPVIREVSFEITPGRVTALVGPNGSGKSTLVNLILGFYRPEIGSLAIGSTPYSDLDISHLRRSMGVVPQQPFLLEGTVAENVAYGRDDASEVDVKRALDLVDAGFVDQLPDGMDTDIGAEGVFLSGGQRQRIAIARALVHQPPLLVLDEPTNHLDRRSVAAVMQSIAALEPCPAVLLVSHQTDVISDADEVIELDAGRVVSHRREGSAT